MVKTGGRKGVRLRRGRGGRGGGVMTGERGG